MSLQLQVVYYTGSVSRTLTVHRCYIEINLDVKLEYVSEIAAYGIV